MARPRKVKASKIDGRNPTKKRINDDKKRKCGGKQKFNSFEAAEEMAAYRQMAINDGHLSAYKCPYCPYYHYGHTPLAIMFDRYSDGR